MWWTSKSYFNHERIGRNMSFPQLNPFFKHPETNYNIALLLDLCHMLKLIRGALFTYTDIKNGNGIIINLINNILIYNTIINLINNILIYNTISNIIGQMISWKYFDLLHQYQMENGLHLANNLTKQHINFKSQVMKYPII